MRITEINPMVGLGDKFQIRLSREHLTSQRLITRNLHATHCVLFLLSWCPVLSLGDRLFARFACFLLFFFFWPSCTSIRLVWAGRDFLVSVLASCCWDKFIVSACLIRGVSSCARAPRMLTLQPGSDLVAIGFDEGLVMLEVRRPATGTPRSYNSAVSSGEGFKIL